MAGKGTYVALGGQRPIQTDFAGISKGLAAEAKMYRDEALRKEQIEEAKQARLTEAFRQDYSNISDIVTGITSLDEGIAYGIDGARNALYEHYSEAKKNPALYNDIGFQTKAMNLKNYSKNLSTFTKSYAEYAQTISSGMTDGTLSQWNSRTLGQLDSVFNKSNLMLGVDPKTGNPVAITLDEDGNPSEINVQKVMDGRGLTEAVKYFDLEKDAITKGEKLGKRLNKEVVGFARDKETQLFKDVEPDVRASIKAMLGKEGSPSDIAKSIWVDHMGMQPKDLTSDDLKAIEDKYVDKVRMFYDEINKESVDEGAIIAAKREKRLSEKDLKEAKKNNPINMRTDEEGNPLISRPDGLDKTPAVSFAMEKPLYIGHRSEGIMVNSLYLTEDNTIRMSGKKYRPEVEEDLVDMIFVRQTAEKLSKVEDFTSGITPEEVADINDVANALGYANANELRDAMMAQRDGRQKKENQTEETTPNFG